MSKKKKKKNKHSSTAKMLNPDYTIYTDGGCLVNPGGQGGYGVVMIDNRTGEVKELSGGYLSTTNNRMELMAAIIAAEQMPEGTSALLHSDSQYLINCYSGFWSRNKNLDLFSRLDKATKGKQIDMVWVRGHSGDAFNERCDTLASTAMFGADLLEDTGFQDKKRAGREFYKTVEEYQAQGKVSAMAIDIKIPKDLEGRIELSSHRDYCEKYHVHNACAAAIENFVMSESRNFKAYAALKTGGIDFWSRKKLQSLKEGLENADAVIESIKIYLPEEKDSVAALRWRRRGLPLSDCIRKVLVDKEIAGNIARAV